MNHKSFQARDEPKELLRILSLYHTLTIEQVNRLFSSLDSTAIQAIIQKLSKQHRLDYQKDMGIVSFSKDAEADATLLSCFWVLLDFIENVTYHTTSDFPSAITFYCHEQKYQIIPVPEGKEIVIGQTLKHQSLDEVKLLLLIQKHEQISMIHTDGDLTYCTVSDTGEVSYFKLQH